MCLCDCENSDRPNRIKQLRVYTLLLKEPGAPGVRVGGSSCCPFVEGGAYLMDGDTTHESLHILVDSVNYSSRGEKSTDRVKKSTGGMGQLYQKRGRGALE